MRILVTGGAGYVGSHAVRHLLECGHQAWVYDDLSRGHEGSVAGIPLIRGALEDRQSLEDAIRLQRVEAVMHFAAFALVGESVADPALYYRNNVAGSLSLLEAMRATGVGKLVFSSTCATYGHPDRSPITEDTEQRPVNPYGFSKLAVERVLADYAQAYGLGYVALRYFNAAGAAADGSIGEDHDPETHAIPLVAQVALGRRSHFTILGEDYPTEDGTCVRDYVHVEDLSLAHESALHVLRPGLGLGLNLGTGRGYSVRQVIDAARSVTGRPIPTRSGARRPGDPPELVADPNLARTTLGWEPRCVELGEIVESAWRWHRRHPAGFAS